MMFAPHVQAQTAKVVILQYSHIGENRYTDTNISIDTFQSHINELSVGGYDVISLKEALRNLKDNTILEKDSVVITIDGGYKQSIENAKPILDEAGFPFTVFFSPQNADVKAEAFLSWSDLKKLSRDKDISLGIHPFTYTRVHEGNETDIKASINRAKTAFQKEFKEFPEIFAYPFGEYSSTYKDIISKSGFKTGLTLNSGAAHAQSDLFSLPRFAMSESFGDIERFRLITKSLPLAVKNFEPENLYLDNPDPAIGFNLHGKHANSDSLNCFISGFGLVEYTAIEGRVEIRSDEPFSETRTRLNCTMAGPKKNASDDPRWRWFGVLFTLQPQLQRFELQE